MILRKKKPPVKLIEITLFLYLNNWWAYRYLYERIPYCIIHIWWRCYITITIIIIIQSYIINSIQSISYEYLLILIKVVLSSNKYNYQVCF